jgi:hypothetical protein
MGNVFIDSVAKEFLLQQDTIKKREKVLDDILAEFEEFEITAKIDISEDYEIVNVRVSITPFFFDFRIDLVTNKLVINAYTNKQLTNISDVRECPLTMANIDELLMSIQSYKNIYVPKFRNI